MEVQLHSSTLKQDGSEWLLHVPAALYAGKEPPDTHWMGVWVDPRAGLKAMAKRNIPRH